MYIKSKLISKWGENVVTLCLWLCLKRDALDYCFWQWQVSDKKLLGNNHALCCQCNINIQTAHLCPRLDKISKVSTYTIFCVANIEMHRDTLLKIVFFFNNQVQTQMWWWEYGKPWFFIIFFPLYQFLCF